MDKSVEAMLHQAHLRFQRNELRSSKVAFGDYSIIKTRKLVSPSRLPVSEIRGTRRERSVKERDVKCEAHWFGGPRPRYYEALFDTLEFMRDVRKWK
jgi:hypothetical protein